MRGTQKKQIKAVMNGTFANVIGDETNNRISGTIAGAVVGLIVGGIFKSNPIYTALVGGVVGFISQKK